MLRTFSRGGVHPPENKLSSAKAIETFPLPDTVSIPVAQHIGAPAVPVVKKGDKVKVGQLIAEAGGFVSANIHSSVSGTVQKVDKIVDASGYKKQSIIIKVEGDEWEESIDRSEDILREITASQEEITAKIKKAGIVGLGGATFPTHVKLSMPPGKSADHLVINGVECEPYLTSDHRVMLEMAEQCVIGTAILMKAMKVEKAIIGIESNKPDAIDKITEVAKNYSGISVVPLKVQYPQGGEKQLIDAVLQREVPSGGLPLDANVVVQNIGTAVAVYDAVQKNKPLVERVVTLTGKDVASPGNFMVRIGTSAQNLISYCGGLPSSTGKVISGGPMMGKAVATTDFPVVKGTSGILLLRKDEAKRPETEACIRCAKCTTVCPMGLEPYLLHRLGEKAMFEKAEENNVMDCIICGSCRYICPSNRPLVDYISLGKAEVMSMIRERQKK